MGILSIFNPKRSDRNSERVKIELASRLKFVWRSVASAAQHAARRRPTRKPSTSNASDTTLENLPKGQEISRSEQNETVDSVEEVRSSAEEPQTIKAGNADIIATTTSEIVVLDKELPEAPASSSSSSIHDVTNRPRLSRQPSPSQPSPPAASSIVRCNSSTTINTETQTVTQLDVDAKLAFHYSILLGQEDANVAAKLFSIKFILRSLTPFPARLDQDRAYLVYVDTAVELLKKLSKDSHEAALILGYHYFITSHPGSFAIFQSLSKQSIDRATYYLSLHYMFGIHVTRNQKKSQKYLDLASRRGHTQSMFMLAKRLCASGGVIFADTNNEFRIMPKLKKSVLKNGLKWLKLALHYSEQFVSSGIKDDESYPPYNFHLGFYELGMLHFSGLPDLLLADVEYGMRLLQKGWRLGCLRCGVRLGKMLVVGMYPVQKSPDDGVELILKSADLGSPEACFEIGGWYLTGFQPHFQQSDEMAVKYFQRAARSGHAKAKVTLDKLRQMGILTDVKVISAESLDDVRAVVR